MNSFDMFDFGHTDGFLKKGFITLFFFLTLTLPILISQGPACASELSEMVLHSRSMSQTEATPHGNASPSPDEVFPGASGCPEASLNIGKAALENRDYQTAVSAFEGMLSAPSYSTWDDQGVTGETDNSAPGEQTSYSFDEAPAQNSSDTVSLNLSRKLQDMKTTRKEHFISAKISLGLDLDDEVNAERTNADSGMSTTLGNFMTVTLDRPEKTQTYNSTATVNYLYKPLCSPLSWKMTGSSYNAVYRHNEDLDVSLTDLKAGMNYSGERIRWEVYGITNRLNLDYEKYLQSYGAGSSLNLTLTPAIFFTLDGKVKRKNYFSDNSLDAQNVNLSLSPVFLYGRNRLSFSLGVECEDAREEYNSFSRIIGNASYEARLPFSSKVYLSYLYKETGYGEAHLFSVKRDDTVQYVTTGFSKSASVYKIPSSNRELSVSMSYTYTHAESTVEENSYTMNALSAGMSMVF
jgi:hypothetical protein